MNTDSVRNLAIFTVGAGIGALVTYKLLKDKYEKFAQEEIDSVKETFVTRWPHDGGDPVSEMPKDERADFNKAYDAMTDEEIDENTGKTNMIYKNPRSKHKKYNTIYPNKREVEPEEEDYSNFKDISDEVNETNHLIPYVITEKEFSEENQHFDKITIDYYELDDTLADEQEEPIPDVSSIVGDEALLCFGKGSNDPDTIYVRNEKLSTDFEVIRLHKSYRETVLGFCDEIAPRRIKPLKGEPNENN